MNSDDNGWLDSDAGPVARPYTLTGGRTRPRAGTLLDLIDIVARSGQPPDEYPRAPERIRILELCRRPITVADLASAAGLPLGVVRVLLSDLVDAGLVRVSRQAPAGRVTDRDLLRKVLDGLHSL
jgi:DNA-binding transcriptional ArsR family regulator